MGATGILWVGDKDTTKHAIMYSPLSKKELSNLNVNSAKVEKHCVHTHTQT